MLSLLGATLTLPGIAGIVLTIGMAVDSNVLIYERIREERRSGPLGRSQAIDTGFTRALATIVDSNVTALIAAVVLFCLGSGPVRGFAVTLAHRHPDHGVHRLHLHPLLIVGCGCARPRPKEVPQRRRVTVRFMPDDTTHPVHGHARAWPFTLSSAACRSPPSCCSSRSSINYGIDFKGGSLDRGAGQERRRRSRRHPRAGSTASTSARSGAGVRRAERRADPRRRAGRRRECRAERRSTKVRRRSQTDYDFRRVESVGPTVSGELACDGTIAVLVALVGDPDLCLVPLRMAVRRRRHRRDGARRDHDGRLLRRYPGSSSTCRSIAAILTIVGYSLNDTVVVYDRVREDLRKYKQMPLPTADRPVDQRDAVANDADLGDDDPGAARALSSSAARSSARFTIAMIFGVVVGTYSSIFIAGPLLILFQLRPGQAADEEKPTAAADGRAGREA